MTSLRTSSRVNSYLNNFINEVFENIEPLFLNRTTSSDWIDHWKQWRSNGICSKTTISRKKLSILIQGPQISGQPRIEHDVYNIIKSLRTKVPLIDEIFIINFDDDFDRDNFTYALRKNDEEESCKSETNSNSSKDLTADDIALLSNLNEENENDSWKQVPLTKSSKIDHIEISVPVEILELNKTHSTFSPLP